MKKIIVERRSHDYMAFLEGHREIWGCGKNPNAAIGDLIRTHSEHFSIIVKLADQA